MTFISYIKAIAIAAVLLAAMAYGYQLGAKSEQNKCLQSKIEQSITITKENKEALNESIEISKNTSEKLKQETEVSNERKSAVAQAKADSDVLRIALPADVVRLLHDATSTRH